MKEGYDSQLAADYRRLATAGEHLCPLNFRLIRVFSRLGMIGGGALILTDGTVQSR
jgi:hypothetical protein